MAGVKNLKVLAAGLCFGVTLLTGCNNNDVEIKLNNSSIVYDYDDNQITGYITFEDLNQYVKVVVLEDNDVKFSRLLIKREGHVSGRYAGTYDYIKYIDLETGAILISYKDYTYSGKEIWEVGGNLQIISETGITSYLVNEDFVKTGYSIEELITFFKENIVPTLDDSEKELVK